MKKIRFLLLVALALVMLAGCASDSEVKQSAAPAATEVAQVKPDEVLMKQLMNAIGSDLMTRGKEANFQLNVKFRHYAYEP